MTPQQTIAAILLVFAFLGSVVLFVGWCAAGYKDRETRRVAEVAADNERIKGEIEAAVDEGADVVAGWSK